MRNRFIEPTFAGKHVANAVVNESETEIVMAMFAGGTDRERFLEIEKRLIELPLLHQRGAEICQRDIVVCGHGKRVRPKRFAVFPKRCLLPRAEAEGNH